MRSCTSGSVYVLTSLFLKTMSKTDWGGGEGVSDIDGDRGVNLIYGWYFQNVRHTSDKPRAERRLIASSVKVVLKTEKNTHNAVTRLLPPSEVSRQEIIRG
jgi:hypothetical protein